MSLYLVATPIGNLEDLSFRAIRSLKEVDLIVAEDTRHSRKLLNHYEIKTPMDSFHAHSSPQKLAQILAKLEEGQEIALISDAGTPGISDPGWKLVSEALKLGIKTVPIPGASAFLTALMASGLPMNEFVYLGFPPVKKGRMTWFAELSKESRTLIFYESPHRLIKTLKELEQVIPQDRSIVLARELTKIHEEFLRGSAEKLIKRLQSRVIKGEWVVLIGPPSRGKDRHQASQDLRCP